MVGLPGEVAGCGWEGSGGERFEAGGVGGGGQDGEPAGGGEEPDGGGDGLLHVVDGAKGDTGEAFCQGFGAGCVNGDIGKMKGADGFAEEGRFLVLGLGEGDGDLRTEDGDGETGEAGAGAEVEEIGNVFRNKAGGEDGFEEVAAEDAFVIADGGEVGAGVPFLQEGEVGGEFYRLLFGDGWGAGLREEIVEAVGWGHRGILVASG